LKVGESLIFCCVCSRRWIFRDWSCFSEFNRIIC